ncbi:hypothetical protein TVAG_094830 [Trichomonas vaginalis G3]|uniref:Uncharacterized protein n=1 Tax=Trichomonas vaginalis (strain ATCC PRA-98 / G3) TaxID=412133 RepID=A2FWB2_TRIV3|nr:hypothetical protein TVAGG3_0173690 [Trichomonas vaginalis G3]EAX90814.1 hypothetical protein TVAG_094830 [Trichomonas vaginalis G3]KAI5548778.1 hypothetical protein TVAGG3_0173690 [Trichomonas vaginalis G3]|eukprot:XP_001303744.1 hypothetical protein [Trichomonas vaginalis G3]
MNLKEIFHKHLKFPLIFSILGILTSSVAFSIIYLLLLNDKVTFDISIGFLVMSLFYFFIIWISVNDFKLQAMCGYIALILILSGISDSLITPTWILQAHWVNKYAVFMTNFTAVYSSLCFLWSKILSLIVGPPSRAMPIAEVHEGFIYVAANIIMCAFLSFICAYIEVKSMFSYRKNLLQKSYLFILIPLVWNFALGFLVGTQRNRFVDVVQNKDGIIISV